MLACPRLQAWPHPGRSPSAGTAGPGTPAALRVQDRLFEQAGCISGGGRCPGCHCWCVTPTSSQLLISLPDPPTLELQGQGGPSGQTRELGQEGRCVGLQQPRAPPRRSVPAPGSPHPRGGLGSPESCEVPGGWLSRVPFSSLAEWKMLLPQQPPKAREQPLLELLPGQPPAASVCDGGSRAHSPGDKDDAGAKWPELQGGGLSR